MARTDMRFREAYNALLDLCDRLDPAAALPSENALADRIGVSRTVVRAGLKRLDEAGIIRWRGREKVLLRPPLRSERIVLRKGPPGPAELERHFFGWVLRFDVPAGTPISVAQLAREFAVAPHTLHELLASLDRFGLIARRPRGGWRLLGFTPDFAVELSEFRTLLEANAVRNLVRLPQVHPVWARLADLRTQHSDLAARIDADFHQFSELDERFHSAINSAVKNRFAAEAQKVVSLIFHYHYMWDKTDEKTRNAAAIDEHLGLIAALEARDADAAEAAALEHLRTSKHTLLSSLRDHRLG